MTDENIENIKRGILFDIWQVNHLKSAAISNGNLMHKYISARKRLFIKLDTVVMPLCNKAYEDLCNKIA